VLPENLSPLIVTDQLSGIGVQVPMQLAIVLSTTTVTVEPSVTDVA
jgi:hypothetical protein